jgi:hypothetical protein
LGSLSGDLLLVPRSSTGVANSIQLFSGQTTPKLRQRIADNGDISFYEDTGTTPKLFWDASAESLGIGTTSIAAGTKLQVAGETRIYPTTGTGILRFGSGGAEKGKLSVDSSSNMVLETAGSTALTINSSGNATFSGSVTTGSSLVSTNAIVDSVIAKTSGGNVTVKTNAGGSIARFNNNLSTDFFGSVTIPDYVIHDGNTATKFGFGSANTMNFISNGSDRLTIANSYAVFNGAGTDYDFRVESDSNTHMLFVDGGNNQVGIGTSSIDSNAKLQIEDSTNPNINIDRTSSLLTGNHLGYINFQNNGAVYGYVGAWVESASGTDGKLAFGTRNGTSVVDRLTIASDGAATFTSSVSTPTLSSPDGTSIITLPNTGVASFVRGIVVNEAGLDSDFRVESNNNAYALYVDGGTDTVSIGTAATDAKFRVDASNADLRIGYASGYNYFDADVANVYRVGTSSVEVMKMTTGETVLNDTGADRDFRVESDDHAHMLFVDGGNDRIGIMNSAPVTSLHMGDSSQAQQIRMDVNGGGSSIKGTDTVNSPSSGYTVGHLTGTNRYQLTLGTIPIFDMYKTAVIFNEASVDMDFRIESNDNANMLFVDGGNNRVAVGSTGVTGSQFTVAASTNATIVLDGDSYSTWVQDAQWNSLLLGGAYYDSGAKFAVSNRGASQMNIGHDGNATPSLQGFIFSSAAAGGSAGTAPPFENLASITRAGTVFNEDSHDRDFRVESNGNTHALFVNAGTSRVGINVAAPNRALDVNSGNASDITTFANDSGGYTFGYTPNLASWDLGVGDALRFRHSSTETLRLKTTESVFNELGADLDFRVESNGSQHAFFVDGGTNNIGIQTATNWALTGGGSASSSSGVSIDMSYDGTIYAGSSYWAGGLKTGTGFFSDASGDRYKRAARQATQISQSSQGGDIKFRSQTSSATAGAVISWHEMADFGRDAVVFNNGGLDQDFRVESDSNTHALFVDGGLNRIGINKASPEGDVHLKQTGDIGNGNSVGIMLESGVGSQKWIVQSGLTGVSNSYFNIRDVTAGVNVLSFVNSSGAATFSSSIAAGAATFTPSGGETVVISRDSAGPYFGNSSNNSLRIITNNASRINISNSGNISTHPPAGNHFVINADGVNSDFRVQSDGDTHMLFVDGGTNHVGIGTPSPQHPLSIRHSDKADPQIHLETASYGNAYGVKIHAASTNESGTVSSFSNIHKTTASVNTRLNVQQHISHVSNTATSDYQYWSAGGSERLRISGGGLVSVSGNVYTSGNISIAAGNGILLGGTAVANKLDDYEEGTWTPAWAATTSTITVQSATYTKIGNLVTVHAYISGISPATSGDQQFITGLPFTASASTHYGAGNIVYSSDADVEGIGMLVETNSSNIYFHYIDGTSSSSLTRNNWNTIKSSNLALIFSATYRTDS